MEKKHHDVITVRKNTGFTLLELIISMSLSAILMTVLVVGLRQISMDWEKQGKSLDNKIDDSLLLLQLEKAIIGTFPYRFKDQILAKEELFFDGSQSSLSWVSTVSPNRNSSLTFWHLEVDNNKGLKLFVLPVYPGNLYEQLEQSKFLNPHKKSFFKDYKITFYYLIAMANNKKQWQGNWSGKEENSFPLGVRIQFEQQENDLGINKDFSVFAFIRADASGG